MAKYIDEFQSPWIKAWFDVGNVVLYGYPQDWIHTLGRRIVKVHLKDFKRKEDGYAWVNLGDGDVDWGRSEERRVGKECGGRRGGGAGKEDGWSGGRRRA